jgi:hypothetical protein
MRRALAEWEDGAAVREFDDDDLRWSAVSPQEVRKQPSTPNGYQR